MGFCEYLDGSTLTFKPVNIALKIHVGDHSEAVSKLYFFNNFLFRSCVGIRMFITAQHLKKSLKLINVNGDFSFLFFYLVFSSKLGLL